MKKALKIFWISVWITLLVIVLLFFFKIWRVKHAAHNFLNTLQPYQEQWKLNQVSWLYRISSWWRTTLWFTTVSWSDFDSYAYMQWDYENANLASFYASNWEANMNDYPWLKGFEKYLDSIYLNFTFSWWELVDWSIVDKETNEDLWKLTIDEISNMYEISDWYIPLPSY